MTAAISSAGSDQEIVPNAPPEPNARHCAYGPAIYDFENAVRQAIID